VRRLATAVGIAALTVSVAACGPEKPPDFQSIWTTSSTTSAAPTTTGKPVAISKWLENTGVIGVPVAPNTLPDLNVSIPTPPGWSPYTNPKIPPTALVLSKGEKYPTAMLTVFKLQGNFDVAEAVKHANADAEGLPGFTRLDASSADYNGFPSSMIQGSYELDGARLHSFNRIVFPTGSPPANQRYLVQLSITALAREAVAQSSDIEAIIRGFVVAAK
jgi:hypothetical protein